MSQAISKIKGRIKSVSGAYKVTSAMKLVSTVKLKTWRNKMLANKEYMELSESTVKAILSCPSTCSSPFVNPNPNAKKRLFVIVSSTLGLCGSYNSNIFKVAETTIEANDEAIILGEKGISHFANNTFKKLKGFENISSIHDKIFISKISSFILKEYAKGQYSEIHLIYSEYKNSLVFLAKDYLLLPLKTKGETIGYAPLMEPSQNELIETLVPLYIKNVIYSKLLESQVCEEASRSNAMENATNNAKEILDELNIEFNKARQGAITQEIIEIVSASKAI